MPKSIIEVKGLSKRYKEKKDYALNFINLSIPKGSIFGILGPNGAGKSTFINILSGLTNKSSGRVTVGGINIDDDPKTVRGNMGVVPQEINIDPFFTPKQIMEIQRRCFYGNSSPTRLKFRFWEILFDQNVFDFTMLS